MTVSILVVMDSGPQLPEAARLLGVSRQSVLRWVISGKLPGYRIMHRWRVSRAAVMAMCVPWTASDANDRKMEIDARLPLSKKELAERERQIDLELRRAGIRK